MTLKKSLPFAALLFGLLPPLALAPFNYWPLMVVGIAGAIWLSYSARSTKQALWLGWLFGVSFFGVGVSWVYGSMQTVDTPVLLAILLTLIFCCSLALFFAFQFWFFNRFLKNLPWALSLIAPLWWLINEWLREWVLTGLPWLYAGYAALPLAMSQLAAVIGVYGLGLVFAFCASWLVLAVRRFRSGDNPIASKPLIAALLLFVITNLLGALLPATLWTKDDQVLKVAAIQSNIDQKTKWSNSQQADTLKFYAEALTHTERVDLMLWPEAAMTRLEQDIFSFITSIDSYAELQDTALLLGIVSTDGEHYFNSLKAYGRADGEYLKQHLVPFGEYVPLERYLRGLIQFFDLPMSTMQPALTTQTPILAESRNGPYFIAPVICYEAAYPNLVRKLAKDANIISVVSNDAWFGDSIGPHQHLQITQMRAIENARPMVRATQNGISAIIDANGNILSRSAQFVEATLTGEITLQQGKTPFQHYSTHSLPILAMMILVLIYFRHSTPVQRLAALSLQLVQRFKR
ncbi:apolipoprotein N-acyltransferase [Reinekea thalattae]|uniref:Apolipoprotein N-acyltransferase n=1 Tax=Reinekea thalattae TaxID=2593301 RepID=A0A5C8Z6K7_9GAMM|nr:apolipoprotein N-acyltransferase [Reinekea thalattae]TXR53735.1 apolipoprotein N-acyltransferase [Reinekea thalattae]